MVNVLNLLQVARLEGQRLRLIRAVQQYDLEKGTPSRLCDNNSDVLDLPAPQAKRRKIQTYEAAKQIHGDKEGVISGLWSTLKDTASNSKLSSILASSTLVQQKILPKLVSSEVKKQVKEYEKSDENKIRSIAMYYDHTIMGKEKWNTVRVGNKKAPGANVIPYNRLQEMIKTIDRPKTWQLKDINGYRCSLDELLQELANMYLTCIPRRIRWFNDQHGVFVVAYGGDGAPLGKYSECSSFLVSLLNVGHAVLSCNNAFTVVAGNCNEDDPRFYGTLADIADEMKEIEGKEYIIAGCNFPMKFKFSEFIADQKFQAGLSGEVNNAARFPSSFANITTDEIGDLELVRKGAKVGPDEYWKPWTNEQRAKFVDEVAKVKQSIKPSLKESTKRKKVLDSMANLGTRQEVLPHIGDYADNKRPDPLHCRNNGVQGWHGDLFTSIMSTHTKGDHGTYISFEKLEQCPLKQYLQILLDINANMLYRKVDEWLKANDGKTFSCRFNGETSLKVMQNVSKLTSVIQNDCYRMFLLHTGVLLRDISGLIAKVNVADGPLYLSTLEEKCTNYYTAKCLATSTTKLSDWTLSFAIPYHARDIWDKYHTGYGIISMQGREAKNQRLKAYIHHTKPEENRWGSVLLHEYVHTVYLPKMNREKDYFKEYKQSKSELFLPEESDLVCHCGTSKSPSEAKCHICSSSTMQEVIKSCKKKKLTLMAKKLLHQ